MNVPTNEVEITSKVDLYLWTRIPQTIEPMMIKASKVKMELKLVRAANTA